MKKQIFKPVVLFLSIIILGIAAKGIKTDPEIKNINSNIEHNQKATTTYSKNINIDKEVKNELSKLPKNLLLDLTHNYDLKIEVVEDLGKRVVFNQEIDEAGRITYDNMSIKVEENQIRHALNHEIGHALVQVWVLTEDEQIQKSFKNEELYFGDYYQNSINEYIAEGIKYYYNNELPDSQLKSALDRVLKVYN